MELDAHTSEMLVILSNTALAIVTTAAAWDTVRRVIAVFRPRRRKGHGRHEA